MTKPTSSYADCPIAVRLGDFGTEYSGKLLVMKQILSLVALRILVSIEKHAAL